MANDSLLVHLAGTETITGDKTFSTPLILAEQGSSPATPANGFAKVYAKSDGYPYWKGDDGIERALIVPISAVHSNPGFEGTYTAALNFNSVSAGNVPSSWNMYWSDNGNTCGSVAALTEGAVAAKVTKIAGTGQARFQHGAEYGAVGGDLITFEVDVQGSGTVSAGTMYVTLHTSATSGQAQFLGTGNVEQSIGTAYDSTVRRIKVSFIVPGGHLYYRFTLSFFPTGNAAGALTFDNSASSKTTPAASGVVTGEIKMWPTATAPTGYLICDGVVRNIVDYPALGALLGSTYGGNGTTTFAPPNLKGKVVVGQDTGQTEFDVLSETGGAKTHTLTTAEIPAHTHPVSAGTLITKGGSTYYFNQGTTTADRAQDASVAANTGGGGAHNNLQPYMVLNYVIKT